MDQSISSSQSSNQYELSSSISSNQYELLVRYFKNHLTIVPFGYISLDTNRMTLAYFALAGLDIMNQIDQFFDEKNARCDLIEWIYGQQIVPNVHNDVARCGFRGSSASNTCINEFGSFESSNSFDEANLSQTYTALCSLLILGDDLQRVHRKAIISSLRYLQSNDGNFRSCYSGGEADLRFVYCACAISSLLNDWSGFDIKQTIHFINSCRRYDGGFALQPDGESHGGSTYLAVASLSLLNVLNEIDDRESLLTWCMMNQGSGYRGRPNKPQDSCYSFWLGASIRLLGAEHMTNSVANSAHLLQCAHCKYGGFSKHEDGYPDLMHSYMALAGLSIIDEIMQSNTSHQTENQNTQSLPWMQWNLRHLDVRLGLISSRSSKYG